MKSKAILSLAVMGFGVIMSQPAHADISAFYSAGTDEFAVKYRMSVEVSDDGSARIHVTGRSVYFLIIGDEVYLIERGIDEAYATRLSDLNQVLSENGTIAGLNTSMIDDVQQEGLEDLGSRTVLGRVGVGYAQPEHYDDGERSRHADLVISQDEALKPIGEAIAQSIDGRYGAGRTMTMVGMMGPLILYANETETLLKSGTPLKLGSLLLSEVSNGDIDASRFKLPKRVLTLEELREMHRPFEWPSEFEWQPKG